MRVLGDFGFDGVSPGGVSPGGVSLVGFSPGEVEILSSNYYIAGNNFLYDIDRLFVKIKRFLGFNSSKILLCKDWWDRWGVGMNSSELALKVGSFYKTEFIKVSD